MAPLTDAQILELTGRVPDWRVVERDGVKRLERRFSIDTFDEAVRFRSSLAELAEQ